MMKRLFDIIAAFMGLLLTFPLVLTIVMLIKKGSQGSVFYRGVRIGKAGKPFRIWKFRTMVQNAEKTGVFSTADDDPRLTTIGKFLKKYQFDELPQLINVLKGEMSIVGPRPEVPFYVDMMTEEEKNIILSVTPGMTDWASLWNFHEGELLKGSSDPDKTYQEKIRPEKIRLQIKYVKERNFLVDVSIMGQTLLKIFQ